MIKKELIINKIIDNKNSILKNKIIFYLLHETFIKSEKGFTKINYILENEYFNKMRKINFEDTKIIKPRLFFIEQDIFNFLKNFKSNSNNNLKLTQILNYYLFIFKKHLKKIKYINYKNFFILLLNTNNQKPKISLLKNNKLILGLSAGIIQSKLDIKEKSIKKNKKMLKLILKILSYNIKKIHNIKNLIIQVKGLKNDIQNIFVFIKKYFNTSNKIIIVTPSLINNQLKFKKIKSIKRKLKKKFIKM
jgi:hypothetical protein